jgi:hypothetical protein
MERFCQAYVTHFNMARAAREAGYSTRSARKTGWDLYHEPRIRARIEELLQGRAGEWATMLETQREQLREHKPRQRRRTGDRQVYVIQDGKTGSVKIGCSRDPSMRLAELQRSTPNRLTLLVAVPGTMRQERALHRRFKTAQLAGEWFTATREILDWIEQVRV